MTDDLRIGELRRHIKVFKHLLESSLNRTCESVLYIIKSHPLDHVVNGRFQCVEVLKAVPFERFSSHQQRVSRATAQRQRLGTLGLVVVIHTIKTVGLRKTDGMYIVQLSSELKTLHKNGQSSRLGFSVQDGEKNAPRFGKPFYRKLLWPALRVLFYLDYCLYLKTCLGSLIPQCMMVGCSRLGATLVGHIEMGFV